MATGTSRPLGSDDPAVRVKNDEHDYPSLLTLGMIKSEKSGHQSVYTLSPKGREYVELVSQQVVYSTKE